MIHMEERHLAMVKAILKKYPYQFYVFGSRVKGTQRKFSDLDLLYKDDIPWNVISDMDEDFEESYLPFKVDIISWRRCKDNFRKLIEQDLEPLNL